MKKTSDSSAKMVMAFDLHEVVLAWSWKEVKRVLRYYPWTHHMRCLFTMLRPDIFLELVRQRKQRPFEKFVQAVAEKYPSMARYEQMGIELVSAYEPNRAVVLLMLELKKRGHPLIVASNIGPRSYALLAQRYPEIFDQFDEVVVADPAHGHRKPHESYFAYVAGLMTNRYGGSVSIFFVDDIMENVQSARQHSQFHAYTFSSAEALREHLISIGCLVDSPGSDEHQANTL